MIRYICKNCKAILYEYNKIGRLYNGKELYYFGLLTPADVVVFLGGRCPRCGRELELKELKDWKKVVRINVYSW